MRNRTNLISYALAAMAGILFVRGIVVLTNKGGE